MNPCKQFNSGCAFGSDNPKKNILPITSYTYLEISNCITKVISFKKKKKIAEKKIDRSSAM